MIAHTTTFCKIVVEQRMEQETAQYVHKEYRARFRRMDLSMLKRTNKRKMNSSSVELQVIFSRGNVLFNGALNTFY